MYLKKYGKEQESSRLLSIANHNNELNPCVSVIVPIYNAEQYLRQCVDSLVRQTLKNIEIILVNDGSTDNSPAMCDAYAEQDKRVKVIHQENGGYGKACNTGLTAARGEYLGIVESDDYVEFDMYETLYSISGDTHSSIIKGSFYHEFQDGTNHFCSLEHITKKEKKHTLQAKDSLYLMIYESSIWSAIYKRNFITTNVIQMLETRGASYQDVVWKFETYATAESITLIDKPVYHYRVMTPGSSSKNKKNYDAMFINYSEIKNFLIKRNKYADYRSAYYLHQFFDALFHLNRLDKYGKKKFTVKMKKIIKEAYKEKITIESFPEIYIPDEIRDVYYKITPYRLQLKRILKSRIKNACLSFYRSKLGSFIWSCLKRPVNNRYIKKILKKLLDINEMGTSAANIPNNHIILDKIYFPSNKKNALILMPSWTVNAACLIVTEMCKILRNIGYNLHLIVYHLNQEAPADSLWDHTYTLKPTLPDYGLSHPFGRDKKIYDANLIDDWVGEDLLTFIRLLDKNCHFELCFCNYVFLSKALTCFDNNVKKILYTHDIYSHRNEHLYNSNAGVFYFGTIPSEEKKGLDRADYIFAVQKKEQLFFKRLTEKPVITLPYVPKKNYIYSIFTGLPLKVGYIGSLHDPNILAIKKYIDLIENNDKIILYIAGTISPAITESYHNIYVLGIIDNLTEFYSKYDLYINPDKLESGLKIKTIEAFSYGKPFICTKEASVGIDVTKVYHQTDSIEELAEITKQCVNNPSLLNEMAEESKNIFDKYYTAYSMDKILKEIVNQA